MVNDSMSRRREKKKIRIGDIAEIVTPAGFAYVQYTHDADTNGELVRVFSELYKVRPQDFSALAQKKESYFVFYTMDYAIRAGQATVVSNQAVPEWASNYPVMRHAAAFDDFGRVTRWRIISAASRLTLQDLISAPLFAELTPEQMKLSIREIWPHAAMVRKLTGGWTPERAEEFHLRDLSDARKQQTDAARISELMKHYLYFPSRLNAEGAGEQLRTRGFSVQIRKGSGGEDWLTLATKVSPHTAEQMHELRDEMESLAEQFGGEYDGWEAAIDSLGSGPRRGSVI